MKSTENLAPQASNANGHAIANKPVTVKSLFENDAIKSRFKEILGEKSAGFISSIINVVNGNTNLSTADPQSVIMSAAVAATLDLPINPNLGFAYIIPYQQSKSVEWVDENGQHQQQWETFNVAQFQMGYKGFIQLAIRTGQYEKINCVEVRAGQLKKYNPLTEEIDLDWSVESGEVIGYVAYFKLKTGFEKLVYWNIGKINEHAKKHSKSFGKKKSPWTTNYHEMSQKTLLKHILSKYGILSIEIQKALRADQAVVKDERTENFEYVDSTHTDLTYQNKLDAGSDNDNDQTQQEEKAPESTSRIPNSNDL